ncbi:nucleotidyltransferase family protein [Microbacterium sp. YY-01]|uniref:nucleotidyltransferase family protein n=1 Tax=Microbacterium sp. YY-01 TaxID=3421634 RepID=UPI003D16F763
MLTTTNQNSEGIMSWVAISNGALALEDSGIMGSEYSLLVLPTKPSPPLALNDLGAKSWLQLLEPRTPDQRVGDEERVLLEEMREVGLVSDNSDNSARVKEVAKPWLASPIHELVYALIARVAEERAIPYFFIKGPMLSEYGLRVKSHSADVDVWVEQSAVEELRSALEAWGWSLQPNAWNGTDVNHSVTLEPGLWGCEIDIHRRMPGMTEVDSLVFSSLYAHTRKRVFAGVECNVLDRKSAALVYCMHLVRPEIGRVANETTGNIVANALSAAGLGVVDIAKEVGAVTVLRDSLETAFPLATLDVSDGTPRDWAWRTKRTKLTAYCAALRTLPFRQRGGVILQLIWPSKEAALRSEKLSGGRTHNSTLARIKRLFRAT